MDYENAGHQLDFQTKECVVKMNYSFYNAQMYFKGV